MKLQTPIKLAWLRFTSCSGCQLTLLNAEEAMAALATIVELHEFPLASSAFGTNNVFDVALVEGSLTSPAQIKRVLALRQKTGLLLAIGACALTGGVNAMVKEDRRRAIASIYGKPGAEWETFPPLPIHHFVQVDGEIPGCPPEQQELLETIAALLHGGAPGRQVMPVCMECRSDENRCLLEEDQAPCLGPITQAGCRALCPELGVPCEGCRGVVPEANRDELTRLFISAGLSEREISHRLERFGEQP